MGQDLRTWVQRWRRALSTAPGRDRVEALLADKDARGLVRSLPPQDLYLLIREVGLADTSELVALVPRTASMAPLHSSFTGAPGGGGGADAIEMSKLPPPMSKSAQPPIRIR